MNEKLVRNGLRIVWEVSRFRLHVNLVLSRNFAMKVSTGKKKSVLEGLL